MNLGENMIKNCLQSTKAQVTDVEAIKRVLDKYEYDFDAEIHQHVGTPLGLISISGTDAFPEALHEDRWPDRDEYSGRAAWNCAMDDSFIKYGKERFVSLL